MFLSQIGLLLVEAGVMAALVLGLFRARSVLGLSPLYIVMGGFQYLEATLSLQVSLWPGFSIYPGSSVMFTTNLFAVLLVYIKEDALEARKLVYGLVLANAGLTLVSLLVSAHFLLPGIDTSTSMTAGEFVNNAQIALVGAALLFVDVIGIILVYEYVSRFTRFTFVRILVALVVVVAFDNFFFAGFLRLGRGDFLATMIAGSREQDRRHGVLCDGALGVPAFHRSARYARPPRATSPTCSRLLTYRQKYEQARDRMIHDPMTGLYNRLHFDEVAPKALAHAQRYDEPVSLLIIDGDHFKTINDRFSHLEGDRVLKLMGETIAAEVRAADIACRFGGDEFVVLLPRTEAEAAGALGERVQVRLRESCAFRVPSLSRGAAITATIGIASHPADGDFTTIEDLVRVADRRLVRGQARGPRPCGLGRTRSPELAPVTTPARTAQA